MNAEQAAEAKAKEIAQIESQIEQLKKQKASKITILAEENIIKLGRQISAHRKILESKEKELLTMKEIKYSKGLDKPQIVEVLEQLKKLENVQVSPIVHIEKSGNTCNDVCSIIDDMIYNVMSAISEISAINDTNISRINKDIPSQIRDTILVKNNLLVKKKLAGAESSLKSLNMIKEQLQKEEVCTCNE